MGRVPLLLLPAVLTALAAGASPARSSAASPPACAKSLHAPALALPAALRVITPCAVYTLSPDGRVRAAAPQRQRAGISWTAVAGAGAPVVQRKDRIAVLRDGREFWRSCR